MSQCSSPAHGHRCQRGVPSGAQPGNPIQHNMCQLVPGRRAPGTQSGSFMLSPSSSLCQPMFRHMLCRSQPQVTKGHRQWGVFVHSLAPTMPQTQHSTVAAAQGRPCGTRHPRSCRDLPASPAAPGLYKQRRAKLMAAAAAGDAAGPSRSPRHGNAMHRRTGMGWDGKDGCCGGVLGEAGAALLGQRSGVQCHGIRALLG